MCVYSFVVNDMFVQVEVLFGVRGEWYVLRPGFEEDTPYDFFSGGNYVLLRTEFSRTPLTPFPPLPLTDRLPMFQRKNLLFLQNLDLSLLPRCCDIYMVYD